MVRYINKTTYLTASTSSQFLIFLFRNAVLSHEINNEIMLQLTSIYGTVTEYNKKVTIEYSLRDVKLFLQELEETTVTDGMIIKIQKMCYR